jgi:hypothetical protein
MTEIEIIYEIIHSETYNDAVLLDIELGKVSDKKLITGMLVDLFSKEDYNADKKVIMPILAQYKDYDLLQCNEYYIERMKEHRKTMPKLPSMDTLNKFISILSSVKNSDEMKSECEVDLKDSKDYVDFVRNLKENDVNFFKNMLIKQELYEEVINLDNIRNNDSTK